MDRAEETDNLWGERWTKLCVNGMRNGVSAATGMGGNERDSHDAVRRGLIRLGAESVRVGQALGYKLGKIGALDPDVLVDANENDPAALAEIERLMLQGTSGEARSDLQRPSMAQDIAKGRRTEIEFMNGYIAAQGAAVDVPAPTHARLTEVVREAGRTRGTRASSRQCAVELKQIAVASDRRDQIDHALRSFRGHAARYMRCSPRRHSGCGHGAAFTASRARRSRPRKAAIRCRFIPGQYFDCAVIRQSNITIEGVGDGVVLTDRTCGGKGILITNGNNITIRNLTLQRARSADQNGAGIRAQGGNLTVEDTRFINNQMGILAGGNPQATIRVIRSSFIKNGECGGSECAAHAIYVGPMAELDVEQSRFLGTQNGHNVKSRAAMTRVINCDIQDGPDVHQAIRSTFPLAAR